MFAQVYPVCLAIVLVQGVAIPLLVPLCWWVMKSPPASVPLARVLGSRTLRFAFTTMIFAEPLLLVAVLVGTNLYPDTAIDRAFAALGETTSAMIGGLM